MAATISGGSTRKNYYGVAYGKLTASVKDVPEGYTEITEADLKSKVQAVEQIDLRKKYLDKGKGDYPYKVFYDSLVGVITGYEKEENDNGTQLKFTVVDTDGDESLIQVKFYSKYNENILNRLLNTTSGKELTFFPYAIPNEAEIDGKKIKFYIQGISLKNAGVKIEPKYLDKTKDANSPLPNTEQVKVQGKATTSRDNRLDFLYSEFIKAFDTNTAVAPQAVKQDTPKAEAPKVPEAGNDLPF